MSESKEDYLEAIYILARRKGNVRNMDIAEYLGISRPSVSRALKLLAREGYITTRIDGVIVLTDKGRGMAMQVYEKHCILTELLEKITCVSKEIAERDACRIEHIISEEVFEGIKVFMNR